MKEPEHVVAAVVAVIILAALSLPGLLAMLGIWYLLTANGKYQEIKRESVNC